MTDRIVTSLSALGMVLAPALMKFAFLTSVDQVEKLTGFGLHGGATGILGEQGRSGRDGEPAG